MVKKILCQKSPLFQKRIFISIAIRHEMLSNITCQLFVIVFHRIHSGNLKNHLVKNLSNSIILCYNEFMQPYKKLFTYWFSVIIYDRTVEFCEREIKSWKLKEQMNGAARSGKQNIVEGSDNLTTSLKLCISLTGVAKSSIEELIDDLEDFLRQRNLAQWQKTDLRVIELRARSAKLIRSLAVERNLSLLRNLRLPASPEAAANFLLTLCHQATYFLNNQVASLKIKHEREGGLTEDLYRKRSAFRNKTKQL